jgi:arylsulfatase
MASLLINGNKTAEARIAKTQVNIFSADDMADVGTDEGTRVADYGASAKFNGKIHKVKIETKK